MFFNSRVTIEEDRGNEAGLGGIVPLWVPIATVWAQVETLAGREFLAAQQVQSEATHRVTILFTRRFTLTTRHRLVWKGKALGILSIANPIPRNRLLVILCAESPAVVPIPPPPTIEPIPVLPATTFILSAFENYERIPARLDYVEDPGWPANTVSVTGQVHVNATWRDTHDLVKDVSAATYWWTIFGLQEGLTYPIKLRWLRTRTSDGATLEDITQETNITMRTSPQPGTGGIRYMDPTGNDANTGVNPTDSPVGTGPVKTLVRLKAIIPDGGRGRLLNATYGRSAAQGGYNFADTSQWDISGLNGSGTAYKTIEGQTAGQAIISGKKVMSTANGLGAWTNDSPNVHWADFSAFMDTAGKVASLWILDSVESDRPLYLYAHLTADLGNGNNWSGMKGANDAGNGFVIDWTRNRIYVKIAGSGSTPPADGRFSAGWYGEAVDFINSKYFIVKDLVFEAFGACQRASAIIITSVQDNGSGFVRFNTATAHQFDVGDIVPVSGDSLYNGNHTVTLAFPTYFDTDVLFTSSSGTRGVVHPQWKSTFYFGKNSLRLYGPMNDVVVRNCTFNQANISMGNPPPDSRITIEDCRFAQHNHWGRFIYTPDLVFSSNFWNRVKDTPNETWDILSAEGLCEQLVIRRCTVTGGADGLELGSSSGNDYCDLYKNTFTRMYDDSIEVDGSGTNSGSTNGAAWQNTFIDTLSAFSLRPYAKGPFWIVANDGRQNCGVFYNIGREDGGVGGVDGGGLVFVYHNSLVTTGLVSTPNQCVQHFSGCGRSTWKNNIIQCTGELYFNQGSAVYVATNFYEKNAFYSTSPLPKIWRGPGGNWGTEALFIENAGAAMSLTGNLYAINPYPSGIGGPVDPALQDVGVAIKGISNCAADSAGNPLAAPLDLGKFDRLLYV